MQTGFKQAGINSAGTASDKDALSANQQQLLEASIVAEQLALELHARELALQKQAVELSNLQETLWSAEDALRDLHLKSLEDSEGAIHAHASNNGSTYASQTNDDLAALASQLNLLAASAGIFTPVT